jgi:hypothetical protein
LALQDITGSFGPTATQPQSSTGGTSQAFNYPSVLPPLTPDQQSALMNRRRAATSQLEGTEDLVRLQASRAAGDAFRQQGEIGRVQGEQSRAGMQSLAGRGVARSPMFVNPFQRQLVAQAQRQTGELQSGLAGTLANLQAALQQASATRERELSQIDFDEATYRSDIARLLGLQR